MSGLIPAGGVELLRLAFVAGIAVALLCYERWNLTTGSVVVPGYLAASLFRPASVVTTVVVAVVCHALINQVVAGRLMIHGRTKFMLLAVTSVVLTAAAGLVWVSAETPGQWGSFVESAGYIVPALIAHDMGRQGVARTVRAVVLSASAVVVLIVVVFMILPEVALPSPDVSWALAFDNTSMPLAMLISTATACVLQSQLGWRAGGFVGGAYLAMFSADWTAIVGLLALAVITYLLVVKGIARGAILFGRRKFSAMLFCSAVLGWAAVSSATAFTGSGFFNFDVLSAFALVPLFMPALIANDIERVGVSRTLGGMSVSALAVLGGLRIAAVTQPTLSGVLLTGVVVSAIFVGTYVRRTWLSARAAVAG